MSPGQHCEGALRMIDDAPWADDPARGLLAAVPSDGRGSGPRPDGAPGAPRPRSGDGRLVPEREAIAVLGARQIRLWP